MKNFKRFAKALLTAFMRASALTFVVSIFVFIINFKDNQEDKTALLSAFVFQVSLLSISTLVFAVIDEKSKYLGRRPELVRLREKIFRRRNKNSKLFWRGMVFYLDREIANALELFLEIDVENIKKSDRSELEIYKGRCYEHLGFSVNAVKCYETALEFGYMFKDIYIRIARVKEDSGDFDGAVETYEKLAHIKFFSSSTYYNIGMVYIKKCDGKKALESFEKSIEKKQYYAISLGGISIAYLLLGDIDKSFEYYEMAIANRINGIDDYKSYYNEMKLVAIAKINKAEQTV